MSAGRLVEYLDHMAEAARLSRSYIEGLGYQEFLADKRTQQAVIMNLVVIGEAAARLLKDHAEFLDTHPEVPWKSMKGMRNRIAHGYFEIDLGVVWETVQSALPELLARLPAIRDEAAAGEADGRG
jgi:uncharacterized protein with HEPN domain